MSTLQDFACSSGSHRTIREAESPQRGNRRIKTWSRFLLQYLLVLILNVKSTVFRVWEFLKQHYIQALMKGGVCNPKMHWLSYLVDLSIMKNDSGLHQWGALMAILWISLSTSPLNGGSRSYWTLTILDITKRWSQQCVISAQCWAFDRLANVTPKRAHQFQNPSQNINLKKREQIWYFTSKPAQL